MDSLGPSVPDTFHNAGWRLHCAWAIAGAGTALCIALSTYSILSQYTKNPRIKERNLVISILVTLPTFSILAFSSLLIFRAAVVFDFLHACLEAFLLYRFFLLIVRYMGGYAAALTKLSTEKPRRYLAVPPLGCCFYCCCPLQVFQEKLMTLCRYGVMQFVAVRPLCGVVAMTMAVNQVYVQGNIDPKQGYVYLSVVSAVSLLFAKWFLVVFYRAGRQVVKNQNVTIKFLLLKVTLLIGVVQNIVFSVLVKAGIITDIEIFNAQIHAAAWANFLLCIELPVLSLLYHYAYRVRRRYLVVDDTAALATDLEILDK